MPPRTVWWEAGLQVPCSRCRVLARVPIPALRVHLQLAAPVPCPGISRCSTGRDTVSHQVPPATLPFCNLPPTLPAAAPSCYSCFDYTNACADLVVGYMGVPYQNTDMTNHLQVGPDPFMSVAQVQNARCCRLCCALPLCCTVGCSSCPNRRAPAIHLLGPAASPHPHPSPHPSCTAHPPPSPPPHQTPLQYVTVRNARGREMVDLISRRLEQVPASSQGSRQAFVMSTVVSDDE